MSDNTTFKVHQWGEKIYRSIQTYWHIQAFFGDSKVLEGYLDSHRPVRFVDGGFLLEDGSILELPDDEDFEPTLHTITLTQEEIKANLQEAETGRRIINCTWAPSEKEVFRQSR